MGPIAGLRRVRTLSFGFNMEVTGGGEGNDDRVGESAGPSVGSSNETKLVADWRTGVGSLESVCEGGLV